MTGYAAYSASFNRLPWFDFLDSDLTLIPRVTRANHLGFFDSLVIRTCLSAGPITLSKLFKFPYIFQAVCTISNQFLTRVENDVFLSDAHIGVLDNFFYYWATRGERKLSLIPSDIRSPVPQSCT